MENTTYTLTKTTLKNGKFHYVVTDNNGNVISERKSNREYVACTIDGDMYFGRLDLIGKGEHGRKIGVYSFIVNNEAVKSTYESRKKMHNECDIEYTIEDHKEHLNHYTEKLKRIKLIAYLIN